MPFRPLYIISRAFRTMPLGHVTPCTPTISDPSTFVATCIVCPASRPDSSLRFAPATHRRPDAHATPLPLQKALHGGIPRRATHFCTAPRGWGSSEDANVSQICRPVRQMLVRCVSSPHDLSYRWRHTAVPRLRIPHGKSRIRPLCVVLTILQPEHFSLSREDRRECPCAALRYHWTTTTRAVPPT